MQVLRTDDRSPLPTPSDWSSSEALGGPDLVVWTAGPEVVVVPEEVCIPAAVLDEKTPARPTAGNPVVDVVIPVYNEERVLASSVWRLRRFLDESFPFPAIVTIVDNASSDSTPAIASALTDELAGVRFLRLEQKGRGRALRAAWAGSDASVVCYMDVDLSTSLDALLPLVAPLLSGHSSLSIGTRVARGSRISRSRKRDLISRTYNLLLRVLLRSKFSDAQCGFKAATAGVAQALLQEVEDDGWFFDTELLVRAQRRGMRIHEVPVDWVEDSDSSVNIPRTAARDLKGVLRLMTRQRRSRRVRNVSSSRINTLERKVQR